MEEPRSLNPLDLIILGVILYGMWRGSKGGLITLSQRTVAIVVSVLVSLRSWWIAENFYRDSLRLQIDGSGMVALSFATVFVGSYLIVTAVFNNLDKALSKRNFNVDGALGALFGGLLATSVLSIAFMLLSNFNFPSEANSRGSFFYPKVKNFSRYALGFSVKALQEANKQVMKYGVRQPVAQDDDEDETTDQIPTAKKPAPIR